MQEMKVDNKNSESYPLTENLDSRQARFEEKNDEEEQSQSDDEADKLRAKKIKQFLHQ